MTPLEHALRLIEQDFRILPVHPRDKRPFGCDWWNRATTDPKKIQAVWGAHPDYNIGIAAGNGLLIIDVDGDQGRNSLAHLEAVYGKLPETVTAISGGDGYHLYFKTRGNYKNDRTIPGIDIRSAGGMVVAPGSVHETGREYDWMKSPDQFQIAEAPDWLLRQLTPAASGTASLRSGATQATTPGQTEHQCKKPKTKPRKASPSITPADRHLSLIITRFPITPGNRHSQTVKAAALLICRGCVEDQANRLLEQYLHHYRRNYKDAAIAIPDSQRAVRDAIKALAEGKLQPCRDRLQDMLEFASQQALFPQLLSQCIRDNTATALERKFLEALRILVCYEASQHPERGDLLQATNSQIQELMLARSGVPCVDSQLARLKKRYISRGEHKAEKKELLILQCSGVRGKASSYILTEIGKELLADDVASAVFDATL